MGKRKLKPVHFSIHERRVLELPLKGEIVGYDAAALRKVIDTFPWVLDAAEYRYDQIVTSTIVLNEGVKIQAANQLNLAVKQYEEKRKCLKRTN